MRDWRHYAACKDEDPELWFPLGDGPVFRAQIAEAKAVCRRCPVSAQCLAWALDELPDGIAGGLTEQERAALRRNQAGRRERPAA